MVYIPFRACQCLIQLWFSIVLDQVLFDCLGEAVRELRSQIRKKEALADLSDALKETLVQRESEVETLRCETDNLRKQKEALMRAIG